jgi:hypothetical protein
MPLPRLVDTLAGALGHVAQVRQRFLFRALVAQHPRQTTLRLQVARLLPQRSSILRRRRRQRLPRSRPQRLRLLEARCQAHAA